MVKGKIHLCPVDVDFDLLDPGNVVYHPNYLVLCDRARTQALMDAGYPSNVLWKDGFALALVETMTKYRNPAQMGQSLAIATRLLESQRVSLFVEQILFMTKGPVGTGFVSNWDGSSAEKIMYEAKIKLVCVSLNPLKAARLPDRLVEALEIQTV